MGDVTTRIATWLDLVLDVDPEHDKPPIVYEFSNDETFESTDHTSSGVYDGS